MLQLIKYYLTYRYGLMLQVGMLLLIALHLLISGDDLEKVVVLITGGLLVSYWPMFSMINRNEKFDMISKNIPLSALKLIISKMMSYYIYMAFYAICFVICAIFSDADLLKVTGNLTNTFALVYLTASVVGKVKYLGDKFTFVNIPNLLYMIIGALGMYLHLTSAVPDYINLYGYISHSEFIFRNLAVLLIFTSIDFITMYLNRNKLAIS